MTFRFSHSTHVPTIAPITSRNRCIRSCGLVLTLVFCLTAVSAVAATFTPLGLLGGTRTQAYDISGNGSAVVGFVEGFSNDTRTFSVFHWSNGTSTFHAAEERDYAATSGDGSVVVGSFRTPAVGFQAFHWTVGGAFEGLGDFPGGGLLDSAAFDASADGSVVVGAGETDRDYEAFRWTPQTGLVGLGHLTPDSVRSAALGVSSDGALVVGYDEAANSRTQAFRWSAQSGMVGLGLLPGAIDSQAHRISGDGSTVVGFNLFLAPPPNFAILRAFRWTERDGMVGLGSLPGGDYSEAYDVSDDGSVIVGAAGTRLSSGTGVTRPFFWTAQTGMVNLQDFLISAGVTNLDGWGLFEARGVSFDGMTIVGSGFHNGSIEAFVATIPEPSTIVLAALAALVPFGLYLHKTLIRRTAHR